MCQRVKWICGECGLTAPTFSSGVRINWVSIKRVCIVSVNVHVSDTSV